MQAGLPADPAIVRAVKAAAKALAAEGAIVTPVEGYLTHAMLDGICRFFEARSYGDVAKLKAAEKKKILPYIVEWATWRARKFTGEDVMSGFLAVQAMREAATKALAPFDFLLSPCTCPVELCGGGPLADRRPASRARPHPLHRGAELLRAAGGDRQLELRQGGLPQSA